VLATKRLTAGLVFSCLWDRLCGIGSWGAPGGAVSENGRLRHGDRGQGPGDRRRMALMSTILLQACPSLRRSYCPPLEWDVLSSVGNGQDALRKQRGRLERSIGSPHSPHVPFTQTLRNFRCLSIWVLQPPPAFLRALSSSGMSSLRCAHSMASNFDLSRKGG